MTHQSFKVKAVGVAVVTLVVAAVGGFLLARVVTSGETGQAIEPKPTPVDGESILRPIREEESKPRFSGERLGLFLAPTDAGLPAQFNRDRSCERLSKVDPGELGLSSPLAVAGKWVPRDPENHPKVFACGDRVTTVTYEFDSQNTELPASFGVVRSVDKGLVTDVAEDRVTTTSIAGRDVILIRSITPDALGQTSEVLIPEPFGMTDVYAFNVTEAELREIVAAVLASTK